MHQLFNGDGGGDLGPQTGELDRCHQLLRVSVHVGVEHEAAEGGPEVKGQRLVHHAQEDELHVQLFGDLVDGQILAVQTHPGKKLQLVPDADGQSFTYDTELVTALPAEAFCAYR